MYKEGKFPFDKIVESYPFEEINQAVEDSESGKTVYRFSSEARIRYCYPF
jgi:Zn-dependent alcohol dehydrogenase